MQKQDYSRFQGLMSEAAQYTIMPGGKDLGDMTTALFAALQEYPFEAVQDAVRACYRAERFFPMLADILKRLEGAPEGQASAAWDVVYRAVERIGNWYGVQFPDPATHFAIQQMGGWVALCRMTYDDVPFRAKDFARYYQLGQRVASWANVPRYLPGTGAGVFDAVTGEPVHGLGELAANHQAAELVAMVAEGMRVSA